MSSTSGDGKLPNNAHDLYGYLGNNRQQEGQKRLERERDGKFKTKDKETVGEKTSRFNRRDTRWKGQSQRQGLRGKLETVGTTL